MTSGLLHGLRNWLWPDEPADGGLSEDMTPSGAPRSVSPTAFVIDDEAAICKFVTMTLAGLGVEAQAFSTAEQVLAALEDELPAIMFLDIALNKSDAVDVIRILSERNYPGIVQLMSGNNQNLLEDVRRIGARHGLNMQPPLQKPFRAEAIRQIIKAAHLESAPRRSVDLDEALRKGWLELWYQPKVDLRSKTLAGAEGLVRCRHPIHGVLAPNCFVPAASDASHASLTEFVVTQALRDWDGFADVGVPMHIAVNTRIGALVQTDLTHVLREHRPKSDRWPGLILEIAESEVIRDIAQAHEIATQLRIYGITFAIDDFGEGHSSFARLRALPFAELKMDASFVKGCAHDAHNAGICQAIINLAHHFNSIAVAEGLETAADLQAVHRMGCDLGQGYLLGRPMPKAQLIGMLRQRLVTQTEPTPAS